MVNILPVCNSFQAKIVKDQLCYEVDLNEFSNKENNLRKELKSGFAFIMDYNEDRQVAIDEDNNDNVANEQKQEKGFLSQITNSYHNQQASIYLDTVGKKQLYLQPVDM